MVSTVTVGLEQSFDVSVTTRIYAGIFSGWFCMSGRYVTNGQNKGPEEDDVPFTVKENVACRKTFIRKWLLQ